MRWSAKPHPTHLSHLANSGRIHCRPQMQKHWWRWSYPQHIMISIHQGSRRLKRQVSFGWFWRVLDFCRFQISNFRENHSRSKIFVAYLAFVAKTSAGGASRTPWSLETRLFLCHLAGPGAVGFPRVFAAVFQRSRMIKLKIKCFEGFHIPNLHFVEAKLPPKNIQTSSTCIKKPSNNYSKNQKRSHLHMSGIFSSHFLRPATSPTAYSRWMAVPVACWRWSRPLWSEPCISERPVRGHCWRRGWWAWGRMNIYIYIIIYIRYMMYILYDDNPSIVMLSDFIHEQYYIIIVMIILIGYSSF